ncbi:family 16 glycosylhydrolase [Algibacter sp. AS12]|uniref:family 16 glycosylhydrolase n=1 Tax=Algibacter sp. AS12 TaxID=3135773 RepID=UPI00398AE02A
MKQIGLFSLLVLFTFKQVIAQTPTKTSDSLSSWKLVKSLSDEFDDSEVDWKKWYRKAELPNTTGWKWNNDANVKIANGVAELTMQHNTDNFPDDGTFFKSGILKSKETFTTGYVEARIKGAVIDVPGTKNGWGVCPSFWLYSDFDREAEDGKTIYCEIDVVELQQFDWFKGHQDDIQDSDHNLHLVKKINGKGVWFRPKQHIETQMNKYRIPDDPSRNYHVYGCEVNEEEIIWYVDGVEIARKPNTDWYRPMNVTVSLGLRRPFVQFSNNANRAVDPLINSEAKEQLKGMPTTMYVDYIRVWEKR